MLRRKWQAEKLLKNPKPPQQITVLTINGEPTADREVWSASLREHCMSKYVDPTFTDEAAHEFTDIWKRKVADNRADGISPGPV